MFPDTLHGIFSVQIYETVTHWQQHITICCITSRKEENLIIRKKTGEGKCH